MEHPAGARLRALVIVVLAGLSIAVAAPPAAAEVVEYDLTIDRQTVTVDGLTAPGMTVDGGIPAPTLTFTEGDTARIHVHNEMDVDTSLHWHGLLVPPGMDGVPYLSFPPIAPRSTFTYEFPIRQSGTYWYHSHTHLQEQMGMYGGIVIHPRGADPVAADRDEVVVLSDWTTENPEAVLRTLRRGSEWYTMAKGGAQSVLGAARLGMLRQYFGRELQRMPPMDIADVAYDRFLANGSPQTEIEAEPGERVRLRIIDGSASTFFHLEFAGGPMTIVSADGQLVEPVEQRRILIAVAESYDVVVTMPEEAGAWELRATAHDGSGYASIWLGNGPRRPAPTVPKPNLYHSMMEPTAERVLALTPAAAMGMPDDRVEAGDFDQPGMVHMPGMEGMHEMHGMEEEAGEGMAKEEDGGSVEGMDHGAHDAHDAHDAHGAHGAHAGGMEVEDESPAEGPEMEPAPAGMPPRGGKGYAGEFGFLDTDISSAGELARDGGPERPWPPYGVLRAVHSTAPPPEYPLREIRLTLDGDMERYVWFIDETPLSASDEIHIREGETVRFIMINRTMMHHPMHLHGHFFRVVNGQGDRAPLKHTVDVQPMSTTVIEFPANEVGDWFFHCHLLYHMMSGMARVVSYESFVPPPEVRAVRGRLYEEHWYTWSDAALLSHMTSGFVTRANTHWTLMADWEVGWQDVPGTEWESTVTVERYRNRFLTLFAGGDFEGDDGETEDPVAVAGLRYLLPLRVESFAWIDSEGEARIGLERHLELTPRIWLVGEVQYDTGERWEGEVGAGYTISKRLSALVRWHDEYGLGGGLTIRF